jgi:hypothetical protein
MVLLNVYKIKTIFKKYQFLGIFPFNPNAIPIERFAPSCNFSRAPLSTLSRSTSASSSSPTNETNGANLISASPTNETNGVTVGLHHSTELLNHQNVSPLVLSVRNACSSRLAKQSCALQFASKAASHVNANESFESDMDYESSCPESENDESMDFEDSGISEESDLEPPPNKRSKPSLKKIESNPNPVVSSGVHEQDNQALSQAVKTYVQQTFTNSLPRANKRTRVNQTGGACITTEESIAQLQAKKAEKDKKLEQAAQRKEIARQNKENREAQREVNKQKAEERKKAMARAQQLKEIKQRHNAE